MRLIDGLMEKYPDTIREFENYMRVTHNLDANKFVVEAPNTATIPHLIAFLEKMHKIEMLDVLVYTYYNTVPRPSYNELVAKSIKVVFHLVENKIELNFTVF